MKKRRNAIITNASTWSNMERFHHSFSPPTVEWHANVIPFINACLECWLKNEVCQPIKRHPSFDRKSRSACWNLHYSVFVAPDRYGAKKTWTLMTLSCRTHFRELSAMNELYFYTFIVRKKNYILIIDIDNCIPIHYVMYLCN